MTKLLVINSFGPMASTLLSGLMEKARFTNIPLRKVGLHQYLTGQYTLESGYMQKRLRESLENHSQAGLRGGVSVVDRNNQAPKALVDYERVRQKSDDINAKTIQELYFKCRNIYGDAVIYKDMKSNPDWHIELTVDIHRYDHRALYDAYQESFDEVYMVHLHRPFSGWINSLASQAFTHPDLKQNVKFFPHLRHADYKLYEEAVAAMPGMHIQFDEMFDTPIEELMANICEMVNVPIPECDLRSEAFDMYGKIVPYETAFKRFDDNMRFLHPKTQEMLSNWAQSGDISSAPQSLLSWMLYCKDMLAYKVAN